MLDDQDPATPPLANLSYAIASARAVVMALIARDQTAAEEAALRTCRDCDLLIRLIQDLSAVLRSNDLDQLTCSHAELKWLARRAEYVLTFVGAHEAHGRPTRAASAQGCSTSKTSHRMRLSPSGFTVASTGLRVRLIPVDEDEAAGSPHDDRDGDHHPGPEVAGPPKPVER